MRRGGGGHQVEGAVGVAVGGEAALHQRAELPTLLLLLLLLLLLYYYYHHFLLP